MDDYSPRFFESMRRQLQKIPPDELKREDMFHMREFAIEALKICESQAQQLMGGDPDEHPISTSRLTLRIEKFSSQMA